MRDRLKKGFTLIELLVVIAILGILSATLVTQFSKVRAMGQSIRCKTNLKSLAQAAMSYAVERDGHEFVRAGSHEMSGLFEIYDSYRKGFYQCQGWVGWTGSGTWPISAGGTKIALTVQSPGMNAAKFWGPKDVAYESITNGALWGYVGKDLSVYVCDVHKNACTQAGRNTSDSPVLRSYVMNAWFGYDYRPAGQTVPEEDKNRVRYLDGLSGRGNAGNLLVFAELPAASWSSSGGWQMGVGLDFGVRASDGVLEAEIKDENDGTVRGNQGESIGFNHKVGSRQVAHVTFADGHVESLAAPEGGRDNLWKLTRLLCNGIDVPKNVGDYDSAWNSY
jgi:prepilin-type N-terminal cleavage/methylation domain-containing protein/prepilin-type processing-associated H-X9-DG protein